MASIGDDNSETESLPDSSPTRLESALGDADVHHDRSDDVASTHENNKRELSESELDEEDLGSDDDSDDRENRFVGPSSTWRFFTEDDRALVACLDQQRASDLSIHLFNAHALKARVRNLEPASKAKPNHSKKRHIKANEDRTPLWHPDEAWTSWPLNPEDVPRRKEQIAVPTLGTDHDDKDSYRKPEAWRPSADLEEEIQALMLRKANERFQERRTEQSHEAGDIDLLADDEEAEAILGPTVRHILSKLDNLFLGLHKDRQRYVRKNSRSQSRSSRSRSATKTKQPSASKTRKLPGKEQEDSDGDTKDSEAFNSGDENENDSSSSEKYKRRRPLKLRDWREVLNTASLAGFNQAAVDRAARRCASLFGETMDFRNLYKCPVANCSRRDRPWEKAWRWREHLKRTHKYSVEEIYEMEAGSKGTGEDIDNEGDSVGGNEDNSV